MVFLGALSLNAESLRALSLSVADVQAAIDSAQSGDTVIVPAGDVIWNKSVTISKSLTLIGTGVNITRGSGNTSSLIAIKNLPSDVPVRVSGFSFDNGLLNKNGGQNTYDVAVYAPSTSQWTKIRVDNCTFKWGSRPMAWIGWVAGVTDHCTFINSIRSFYLLGNNSESWKHIPDAGSGDFVFCEDCTFKIDNGLGGSPTDLFAAYHEQGSVMRYCTFDGAANTNSNDGFYDAHGNQNYWAGTSNDFRSTPVCGFYNNTIHLHNNYRCADLRGGSYLWYTTPTLSMRLTRTSSISVRKKALPATNSTLFAPDPGPPRIRLITPTSGATRLMARLPVRLAHGMPLIRNTFKKIAIISCTRPMEAARTIRSRVTRAKATIQRFTSQFQPPTRLTPTRTRW